MIFKKVIFLFLVLTVLGACDNYKKVQQSTNYDYKYEMAVKYYGKKDYEKASELFKELLQAFRGTGKTEQIFYYWVYCDYYLEDYLTAAYSFRRFIQSFPRSDKAEELQYMIGVCYKNYSPAYTLDQEYTLKAIEEYQLFLDKYPKGKYAEEANKSVDELQYKLERKSYETAKLYFQISEYRSSVVAGENFCREFPDSKHAEEVRYTMVVASYDYAEKSMEEKQIERFKQVIVYAEKFAKSHPKSDRAAEVLNIKNNSVARIKELRYKLPLYYFTKGDYVLAAAGFDQLLSTGEFAEKSNEMIYYKLKAQYLNAFTVEPDRRSAEFAKYKTFVDQYRANESFAHSEYYKELNSRYVAADKAIAVLPSSLGDEYFNLLNFEKAAKYYYAYADQSKVLTVQQQYILKGLDAEVKAAAKTFVLLRLDRYEKINAGFTARAALLKGSKQEAKAAELVAFIQDKIASQVQWVFNEQFDQKQFAWVKSNGQKYLLENKLGKYQDEIVYLLAVSEYRLAKASEKYERLGLYNQALQRITDLEKMNFTNPIYAQKVSKVKMEVNTKIEKLTKRSHGLQKN
jgi:outer membrane protein assembly factor BamD